MMKRLFAAMLMAGVVAVPGFAFAQSAYSETATPGTFAPDSYYAPIHGGHDKGAAVRANEQASAGGDRSGPYAEYYGSSRQ
jgi:hypothetical protein